MPRDPRYYEGTERRTKQREQRRAGRKHPRDNQPRQRRIL